MRTLESAIRSGNGRFEPGWRETSIFITPGFEFRAVGKLLTNFHLPESTLLMLVSRFRRHRDDSSRVRRGDPGAVPLLLVRRLYVPHQYVVVTAQSPKTTA